MHVKVVIIYSPKHVLISFLRRTPKNNTYKNTDNQTVLVLIKLKCPYYAYSNITFHAVCHVAVCEQTILYNKVVKPTVHDK